MSPDTPSVVIAQSRANYSILPFLCFSFNPNNLKQTDAHLISVIPSAVTETWTTWILLEL